MSSQPHPAGQPRTWGAIATPALGEFAAAPADESALSRAGRGLGGVCMGMLLVLAAVVWGAQWLSAVGDYAGPGALSVTLHSLGAVGAVGAQSYSDRRGGVVSWAITAGLLIVVALLLFTQWWS